MTVVMQASESKNEVYFEEVKKFAGFLLQEKMDEVAREYVVLLRQHNVPLLHLFSHLTEEELLTLGKEGLLSFYRDIQQDTALTNASAELTLWKADNLPGIPRDKVALEDFVLIYSIRKQLFLKFLPQFTNDCHLLVTIMQEVEQFDIALKQQAFGMFVEIQKEELNTKNEFLSSLVRNSDDAIVAVDEEYKITEWNPVAEALFGKGKTQVLHQEITVQFPHLINSDFLRGLERALKGERIQMLRQRFINRGGWYDANLSPLYNNSGSVTGVLSVIHDVTEAVEQEEKLKEHQEELLSSNEELQESLTQLEETQEILQKTVEQLEEAQAIAHLGHWEYDIQHNQIFWSKELRTIFGNSHQELALTYDAYLEYIHPEDRELLTQVVLTCFEKHEPYCFEHRICRPDGGVRWLLAQGEPLLNNNGQLLKLRGIGMDITERKLAELRVQEDQHFIHQVTNTTPDVITVFDLEKRVNIYGNRELYDILGYTPEEVAELRATKGSQWIYTIIHPEDLPKVVAFLESFRSYTGTAPREIAYRGKIRSGAYLWVTGRYSVFKRNSSGMPIQIIGITRDVTQQKQAEELILQNEANLRELNNKLEEQVMSRTAELTRKNYQLGRINADLDTFIYTASHDLKAPIANLEGLLTLLDSKIKSLLSEREQDLLNMMHTSVGRFKKTIKDLTDIAHMQKELEEEVSEAIQLPALLEDVQADLGNLFAETSASIETELEVEQLAYNRKNLRSILHNLISNAIKYRHADRAPVVAITTQKLGDYVLLQVRDNGQGIPEKQQDKVFGLFKRLHKDVEGSGMGLYIVKRIVENSGGRIEVESKPGEGSCFKLYLLEQL